MTKVTGTRLERAPALVRQLEETECREHDELVTVDLIVAQDGRSAQWQTETPCCDEFASAIRTTLERFNLGQSGSK